MSVDAILNSGFVQIALPIMFTILIAAWNQNKRFDDMRSDMNRRFDKIDNDLREIRQLLMAHDQRITRLEERTTLLR